MKGPDRFGASEGAWALTVVLCAVLLMVELVRHGGRAAAGVLVLLLVLVGVVFGGRFALRKLRGDSTNRRY